MGCYLVTDPGPTKREFDDWVKLGFTGDWKLYLSLRSEDKGRKYFLCGREHALEHCSDCCGIGEFLCDFPVGKEKTCDRIMCREHAKEVAPNIHYCEGHYLEWIKFRDSGGVNDKLKNVIAYKGK
jgi:hypothetical protein